MFQSCVQAVVSRDMRRALQCEFDWATEMLARKLQALLSIEWATFGGGRTEANRLGAKSIDVINIGVHTINKNYRILHNHT